MNLADLMCRAVFDQETKQLLFEDPARAVAEYGLDAEDERRLLRTSRGAFDSAIGRLLLHCFIPMPLGGRLLVAPEDGRSVGSAGQVAVVIDQSLTGARIGPSGTSEDRGHVFGTGTHPTTRLCAHMLEKHLKPCMRVLDLGTGSGILALAAAKLGAREVVGLDVDPQAIRVAEANACGNGLEDRVRFFLGDAGWSAATGTEPFDLVVSNILAGAHLHSIEQGLISSVTPGGVLILSGMQEDGAAGVAQALVQAGCKIVEQARMGCWHALVAEVIARQ